MQTLTELEKETSLISTFNKLVQTYQQISIMRIQKTRDEVLKSRNFMGGLLEVFKDVHAAYYRELLAAIKEKEKKRQKLAELKEKGKTTAVFLSPTKHFSGEIVNEVFEMFENYLKENSPTTLAVIGKTGKKLADQSDQTPENYQYFDIDESQIEETDFLKLIKFILPYPTVEIFSAQFVNLVKQKPVRTNLTANQVLLEETEKEIEQRRSYWFEPQFDQILDFFEKEVFATLFRRTIHESRLGNLGSRIKTLESANQAIEKKQKKLNLKRRKLQRHQANKRRQQRLAGMALWSN